MIHRTVPTLLAPLAALALACATAAPKRPAAAGAHATVPAAAAPKDPAALVAEGEAAIRKFDFARADALLAQAVKLAPTDPRPLALRSYAVFQQARFKEGLDLAQASLALGETYDARLVEGRVSAIERKLDEAVRAYERCAALRPESPEAWSAVAAARLAVGDVDVAQKAWDALAKLEDRIKAEDRLWTDILRLQPDPAQVQEALDRSARGTAALVAGDPEGAAHELRTVVRTIATFGHAWSELGKAYAKLGNIADAEHAYRKALEVYRPDQAGLRADTQALLARLLLEQKKDAKEALALAKAAAEVRQRPDVAATLALACEKTRDASCAAGTPSARKVEASATGPSKPVPAAATQR